MDAKLSIFFEINVKKSINFIRAYIFKLYYVYFHQKSEKTV